MINVMYELYLNEYGMMGLREGGREITLKFYCFGI